MIYFQDERKRYAFRFEKELSNNLPADWISFVTASPYFLHPNDPLAEGPHRLQLFIQDDEYGNPALHSISMPAYQMKRNLLIHIIPNLFNYPSRTGI